MADESGPDDPHAPAEGTTPAPADGPPPPAAQAPAPAPAEPAVTRPPVDPAPPTPAANSMVDSGRVDGFGPAFVVDVYQAVAAAAIAAVSRISTKLPVDAHAETSEPTSKVTTSTSDAPMIICEV